VNRDLKDRNITKELALDRRLEASNSCARILIFSSTSFIVFYVSFFFLFPLFHLLCFSCFIVFSPFLIGFFIPLPPPLLFHLCFCLCFRLLWVSSTATCLGLKDLVVLVVVAISFIKY
jgi:hypothetical protein